MSDFDHTDPPEPAEEMAERMRDFAERGQRTMQAFMKRQAADDGFQIINPLMIGKAFMELGAKIMTDPQKMAEAQAQLLRGYSDIFFGATKRLSGEAVNPIVEPATDDRRFKDAAWSEQVFFDTIKQVYLLTSTWMQDMFLDVDGLDQKTREKVEFYTRQYLDAWSPTNFVATNPKVLERTMQTGGENLLQGMNNLLVDLEKGQGQLKISMTDSSAFQLGENVATSPGKVLYQNDLMQLIQYDPVTEKVMKRPLVIVPPWINKFYILDLQPKNSFIKWAIEKGHTVFVISWINPDQTLSHKRLDDYMLEGPLAALTVALAITGADKANIISYCIGGTLTAAALAYLAEKGDDRVASVTFLTTMIDFAEPGELGVFIDEEQLDRLEEHMVKKGYLDGGHMSQVFNMMRDKDLIWSFVINNYLMGCEPMAFDLLYWNADPTRMPAMMHSVYLRELYLKNKLIEPGGITLDGTPIDLTKITVPVYIISTKDDHIAPWKSTYAATQIYKGPVRFVLSSSGHIAGVVNPPAAGKYCFWSGAKTPADPEAWFSAAKQTDGSWWPDWQKWVKKHTGTQIKARKPGNPKYQPLEDAPGSYVKVHLNPEKK